MSQTSRLPLILSLAALGVTTVPLILPFLRRSPPKPVISWKTALEKKPALSGFESILIPGPGGKLELVTNANTPGLDTTKAPILLVHGGMGSARCYDHWATYLASKGRKVYALSLRGHGRSDRPHNFSRATKSSFAQDLAAAVSHIQRTSPLGTPAPVLVGHSAGGGLSQYALSSGILPPDSISGVVLVAAFPPFGGYSVFVNWFIFDPLFFLRHISQLGDPNSPLSSPALVKRAFFHDGTRTDMDKFFKQVNPEESMGWPYSQMFPLADVNKVKAAVSSRVHIISGKQDRLMSPDIMGKMLRLYNREGSNVSMDVVEPSGHHIMWDDSWLQGVQFLEKKLTEWNL